MLLESDSVTDTTSRITSESSAVTEISAKNEKFPRIEMEVQGYYSSLFNDQNIVEIPKFAFEGVNHQLKELNIRLEKYHELNTIFKDEGKKGELFIRAYPFFDDKYLQVVMTDIKRFVSERQSGSFCWRSFSGCFSIYRR